MLRGSDHLTRTAVAVLESRSLFDHATELVLEIHFGEGGEDSKTFVMQLYEAYAKYAQARKLTLEELDLSHGHVIAKISGIGVGKAFRHESGKHVVQRVPKTERNGRKQTSVVSVAVLPLPPERNFTPLPESELSVITQRGHGPGGQHQNTTDSAVRMKHIPTGLMVFINGKNQKQNRKDALRILSARVHELHNNNSTSAYNNMRRGMVDTGRGDKIRTYNFMESRCTDHRLNTHTTRVDLVMKGQFDLILK